MTFKNGVNAAKENYGSGYKFINVLDIIENEFLTHDNIIGQVNIDKSKFSKNIVEYGDILFQRSSETREDVGQSNVYLDKNQPATFGGFVIRGKKIEVYNPLFLNYLLKTSSARKEITSKSGGSTRYNVGQETLSSVSIIITSLSEQGKIASFLSLLDKRIKTQIKIIDRLESLMKGLNYKIFCQSIRFKNIGGSCYSHWKEKRLKDLGKTYNGLSGKIKTDFGIGCHYIQYMQIYKSSKINPNEFGLVKIETGENQNKVRFGDILFTTSSETPREVGVSSVMLDSIKDVYLNSFCFGYRPESLEHLVPEFTRFLFRTEQVRRKIIPLAQGSTRYNISKKSLMKTLVEIPCRQEQLKISKFLSSFDEKIEKERQILTQYQLQKKFLLQNLFV